MLELMDQKTLQVVEEWRPMGLDTAVQGPFSWPKQIPV